MATYLRLDIGASDIDLNDRVNYRLGQGWRPRVPRRRASGLAGWLYEDAVEEIPIQIFSEDSLDDCLDARDAIVNALDQAHRWRHGEAVEPVLFKCKIDGSSLTNPLQTEVLDGDGEDLLQLQPDFNQLIRAWEIHTTLRLLRKGDLLGDTDSDSAAAGGPATLLTCTLTESIPLYSPLSIDLAGMDYQTDDGGGLYSVNIPKGLLLVASSTDRIKLIEAEEYDSGTSSPVTDVVDAAASGGGYIRMSSGQSVNYTGLITNGLDGATLIGVYAMCNLTSDTDKWSVTTTIYRTGSIGANEHSETITIDGMTGYNPVRLGMLGRATANYDLKITVTRISGSGSIEFDVYGLLALGAPSEQAISTNQVLFFDSSLSGQDVDMGIRHNRLSDRLPAAYVELAGGGQGVAWSYDGVIHLASIGDTVIVAWLAGGSTWRHNDDAGVVSLTLTASRRRSYLAPR